MTDPILDPDTGEVLAVTPEEREALVATLAEDLVAGAIASARARRARELLADLVEPGQAFPSFVYPGWAVTVKPPATAKRTVIGHALDAAAEGLPDYLRPRTETVERTVYPGVADLTTKKARADLARRGLSPEAFLHRAESGPVSLVIVEPDNE